MAQPDSYEMTPAHAAGGLEGESVLQSTLGNENAASAAPLREDRGMNTADLSHIPSLRACGCSDKNGRRLVVCVDGTSNQFGKKNTNVIELYRLIKKKKGDNQLTYYNSGIGTYATPSSKTLAYYKRLLGHKIDLAIAWNFERIIIDAYRWLSENYEDGDCIFLFGFSRGAYQVRVLSAMIRKVGLIHRGNEAQIPFAYQLYADPDSDNDPPPVNRLRDPEESPLPAYSPAKTFKKTFSREVKVHFVGVWDTVSSIGVVRARKLLPGTIDGMTHVCFFRHALALDERRVKFLPEYANGGAGPSEAQLETDSSFPHTKEVWFAGTHSDVGGGTEENPNLDKTRPSLRWMFSESSAAGLHLDAFNRAFKDEEAIEVHESLTLPWRPFERLPFRRLTYNEGKADGQWTDYLWIPFELLAWLVWKLVEFLLFVLRFLWMLVGLVWLALKLDWRAALQSVWRALRSVWRALQLVWWALRRLTCTTMGLNQEIRQGRRTRETTSWPPHRGKGRIIQEGQKIHTSVWRSENLGTTAEAQSVYCVLINVIRSCLSARRQLPSRYTPRAHMLSEKTFWDNLRQRKGSGASVGPMDDPWKIWKEVDLYDSVEDLIERYTNHHLEDPDDDAQRTQLAMLQIHANSLNGRQVLLHALVDQLKDDKRAIQSNILCIVIDILVQSSHTARSRIGVPSSKHTLRTLITSSCLTALDASQCSIVQQLLDITEQVLIGHTRAVRSVAFSPDGTRIVSGSGDKTIRTWDAETGQAVGIPLEGHTRGVYFVVFSPDGTRIVSGSEDATIRIWDAETGQAVGIPLEGHTRGVYS